MAKKAKDDKTGKKLENINEVLTSSEQFVEKNQKLILYFVIGLIIVVGAVLAYKYLYIKPRNIKAEAAIFRGERYFDAEQDSLALFGNGNNYDGFESIIKEFSGTKTANLAHAYAGISYSRIGDNEKALQHLNKFKGSDLLISPAIEGSIGDVYMNLGQSKQAVSHFKSAAKKANDEVLSPIFYQKEGLAYLYDKQFDKAIEIFEMIKDKYINSLQANEADKYIEQAKLQKKG